jgi:hypothetical protein
MTPFQIWCLAIACIACIELVVIYLTPAKDDNEGDDEDE